MILKLWFSTLHGFYASFVAMIAAVWGAKSVPLSPVLPVTSTTTYQTGDSCLDLDSTFNHRCRRLAQPEILWLPFVTAHYVRATGDDSILSESVPFLEGDPLPDEEHERYARYGPSGEARSLMTHCRRALERGLTAGVHGLPLIGDGDWNDGMNRVGARGRGESVWLGWFLCATCRAFAEDIVRGRSTIEDCVYMQWGQV